MIVTICLLLSVQVPVATADTIWHQVAKGQGMDRWFGSYYSKTSQYDSRLRVGGWGDEYDSVIRFDLSGLPQTATKAVLWLYVYPEGVGFTSLNWNFATGQWQSGTIGWDSRPSFVNWGNTPAPTATGWYGIDVTFVYNTYWRRGLPTAQKLLNYGLLIRPTPTPGVNRYTSAYSSNSPAPSPGPLLQVDYTRQWDDNLLKLRWPLATAYSSRYITLNWDRASTIKCNDGRTPKWHNGTDYRASFGTEVYTAEDGVVRKIHPTSEWKSAIVIDHSNITRGKYTTVYWHVNPLVKAGDFVPKGMKIATIADLGSNTHFHFGIRLGTYVDPLSYSGALPPIEKPECDTAYPVFPGGFVNPENTGTVLFQP